jgi:hypothetical protein
MSFVFYFSTVPDTVCLLYLLIGLFTYFVLCVHFIYIFYFIIVIFFESVVFPLMLIE